MDSLSSLAAMGGYAGYVWPAYATAFVVMVGVLLASIRAANAREKELDLLQQMRPSRRRQRPVQGNPETEQP